VLSFSFQQSAFSFQQNKIVKDHSTLPGERTEAFESREQLVLIAES
jgi:hypothetical protein